MTAKTSIDNMVVAYLDDDDDRRNIDVTSVTHQGNICWR